MKQQPNFTPLIFVVIAFAWFIGMMKLWSYMDGHHPQRLNETGPYPALAALGAFALFMFAVLKSTNK